MAWQPVYEYRIVSIVRVVDGDTFWATIDRGFREEKTICCRLRGIDTWEKTGANKEKGLLATTFTQDTLVGALAETEVVWCRTYKDGEWDNFGRVLVEVFIERAEGTQALADLLRANGHEKTAG